MRDSIILYQPWLVSRTWEAIDSSLSVVFHEQRFPIAPQWITPTLTACLTPTECQEASDSAENAPAMRCRAGMTECCPAYAG